MPRFPEFRCDTCGRMFAEFELVETIEEYLCEECASGITDEEMDEDYLDGQEAANDDWD